METICIGKGKTAQVKCISFRRVEDFYKRRNSTVLLYEWYSVVLHFLTEEHGWDLIGTQFPGKVGAS